MAEFDLKVAKKFEAKARLFSEFELYFGSERILHLAYYPSPEVEKLGGVSYRCKYDDQVWELQFYQSPYLERESYRVLLDGNLAAATQLWRTLRTVDVTFPDGTVWRCRGGLRGISVRDANGLRMLQASSRPSLFFGRSIIKVDGAKEKEHILPMLMVLMHITTHTKPA